MLPSWPGPGSGGVWSREAKPPTHFLGQDLQSKKLGAEQRSCFLTPPQSTPLSPSLVEGRERGCRLNGCTLSLRKISTRVNLSNFYQ